MTDIEIKKIEEALVILKTEVEKMRPDFEFAQIVKQDDKLYSIKEAADILKQHIGIGRNKLFKYLRENGILSSNKSNFNLPYREYIDRGYFDVKIKNTPIGVQSVTFFTIKGIEWIIKLWRKKHE